SWSRPCTTRPTRTPPPAGPTWSGASFPGWARAPPRANAGCPPTPHARRAPPEARPLMLLDYAGGILFVAENPSTHLHKVAELYDRIAFAAVGRFSEFENLRHAGVRLPDIRGYAYGREDVTSRSIANAYSQTLGQIFVQEFKPYEVEL